MRSQAGGADMRRKISLFSPRAASFAQSPPKCQTIKALDCPREDSKDSQSVPKGGYLHRVLCDPKRTMEKACLHVIAA